MRTTSRVLGKILCAGLALITLLAETGCITSWKAKASVYDAFYANQTGDNPGSLAHIQQAIREAHWPGVPGYVVIETYDDAGLYYFLNNQPREAFIHQAVAVLLAEVIETPATMRKIYLDRLLKALSSSEITLDASVVSRNVRVLLTLPEVRDNPAIRKYYGESAASH